MRRPEQSRILVERDTHGYLLEDFSQAPFVKEGSHKPVPMQERQNLWREAPTNTHTAEGKKLERQVSCLRRIDLDEKLQSMDAARVLRGQCHLTHNRRWVPFRHPFLQRFRLR